VKENKGNLMSKMKYQNISEKPEIELISKKNDEIRINK